MRFIHSRGRGAGGKAPWLIAGLAATTALGAGGSSKPISILLDQSPLTLNPRLGSDAASQRLNALLLRALSRIDKDLEPQPDLAEKWSSRPSGPGNHGQTWRFEIRQGLVDQAGEPITPEKIAICLDNYRVGKPVSAVASDFSHWKETHVVGNAIELVLEHPDPYLLRNLSLLRYFRVKRPGTAPCAEPKASDLFVGSGAYQVKGPWRARLEDENELDLVSASSHTENPLHFVFIQDDNTRGIQMLRGEIDAAPSSISPPKQRWLVEKHADKFRMLSRDGIRVYYLAFNASDPILKKREVRQAIAYAIDRDEFLRTKFRGFGSPSGSLLSPLLPESYQASIPFDPARSEKLLDTAGYPRGKDGTRFHLKYKTTSVRDGYERAVVFREMLRRVGIAVDLEVVEPAVFFAQIRAGGFQLYSSSWLGISDASIFQRTLRSGDKNRYKYANPEMDKLVDAAMAEMDLARRKKILEEVQKLAAVELPFVPLWFSSNTVVVKKDSKGVANEDLSLSGALEPLTKLRYDSSP